MRKLILRPNSSGYAATAGNEIVSAQVAGGASRSRRDFIGSPFVVNVSWMLDEDGFNYLNAFFRTATANGSLHFLCDLLIDNSELAEHTCKFVPNSFQPVSSTTAFIFNAKAQFEVLPSITNEDFDNSFMDLFEMQQMELSEFSSILEKLANVYLPDIL